MTNTKYLLSVVMIVTLLVLGIKSLNLKEGRLSSEDNQAKFDASGLIDAVYTYKEDFGELFFPHEGDSLDWIDIDNQFFPEFGSDDYINLTDTKNSKLNKVIIGRIVGKDPYMKAYSTNLSKNLFICFKPISLVYRQEATLRCNGGLPEDFPQQACNPDDTWYCMPF